VAATMARDREREFLSKRKAVNRTAEGIQDI
jgi:hypothetical protein